MYFHPKGRTIHRTYGFVLNAVYQLSVFAEHDAADISYKTYYLADYKPLNLLAWSSMIQTKFASGKVRELPLCVLQLGALVGETMKIFGYTNPPLSKSRLKNLLTDAVYDLNETQKVCGELPFETSDGVELTVKWMLEN